MPIPYTDIRALVDDAVFQRRLQVALWREASKIVRQASPTDAQLAWARAQLTGPSQQIIEATIRVATGGSNNDPESVYNKGADVSDADLQRIVSLIAPDLAGG
jgi:hypothetical protein